MRIEYLPSAVLYNSEQKKSTEIYSDKTSKKYIQKEIEANFGTTLKKSEGDLELKISEAAKQI